MKFYHNTTLLSARQNCKSFHFSFLSKHIEEFNKMACFEWLEGLLAVSKINFSWQTQLFLVFSGEDVDSFNENC